MTGSFQTIGGTITEIDAEKQEIKINDLQSQQPVTIVVSKDSPMRTLTPELLTALTPAKPAARERQRRQKVAATCRRCLISFRLHASGVEAGRVDPDLEHKGRRSRARHGDRGGEWSWTVVTEQSEVAVATAVSLGAMSLGGP